MANIIIVHGSMGNPNENWFPWLKSELEKEGHRVFIPHFPTPKNQSLDSWRTAFKQYEKYLNDDAILVGHSTGALFIMDILERIDFKIKASFLVASTLRLTKKKELEYFNDLVKTFIEREFNWKKIKGSCYKFFFYHSDNDPYIPVEEGMEFSKKLRAKFREVKSAGHFNKDYGYLNFNILLEDIESVINENMI